MKVVLSDRAIESLKDAPHLIRFTWASPPARCGQARSADTLSMPFQKFTNASGIACLRARLGSAMVPE